MARIYSDESVDQRMVDELRILGHDIVTALEAGQANQRVPDAAVLAYAVALQRAVLTLNRRHFRRLHRTSQPHFGIITCTDDSDRLALATRIHQALLNCSNLENANVDVIMPNPSAKP